MPATSLPDLITQFLNYLEIEKNSSKLTIRDYKHYLEVFARWFEIHMKDKGVADINLATIRAYRK
jgi:site-specific recombinase XerD